jgi:hypothetical protein
MHGKLIFGAGVGIGYLLGTRAGRERFDQITGQAKRFWESDTVQEAAGVVQTQAGRLYGEGKKVVSDQAHKMRENRHDKPGKMRHTKRDQEMRNRGLSERDRMEAGWESPAGYPASSTTTPY